MLGERFSTADSRERTYRLFVDYQGSVIVYKLYQNPSYLERLRERAIKSLGI